jgi:hypothetical protein
MLNHSNKHIPKFTITKVPECHVSPLLENNLRQFNQHNEPNPIHDKQKSDTTTDQEIQLEVLSKDIEDISILKSSIGKLSDSASFIRRYFFVSGVTEWQKKMKDSYFMHSQLLAVYSDSMLMQRRKEFSSFLQDSIFSDIENLELSASLDFLNKSKEVEMETSKTDPSILICRLKSNTINCTQAGNTFFFLVRWTTAPLIIYRSDNGTADSNGNINYETEAQDGDLVILGLNTRVENLSDEEMKEMLEKVVRGKKCSASSVSNGIWSYMDSKFGCERKGTLIASWVAYSF